jgi:DNA-binding transcriptional ArsR family regulator
MAYEANELASVLKILSVETRVRIIQILQGRVLCVGALASQLGVTQGAVSQHLRVMRDVGLVVADKRGYYVHYRLNDRTLDRWRRQIDGLLRLGPATKCRCAKRIGENHKVRRCGPA